jgi:putative transposase
MMRTLLLERPEIGVRTACELMGVSHSWYYERAKSSSLERAVRAVELRDAIERIALEFPGYGYRRVAKALARQGWVVNHKHVLRVMREESLLCQLKKRFVVSTTDSEHDCQKYPNLLGGAILDGPDQGWVSDITYVRLPSAFVYLAAILDAYSRVCVGWALSRWIDTHLTLLALEMALAERRPAAGLIHHSDSQNTGGRFRAA